MYNQKQLKGERWRMVAKHQYRKGATREIIRLEHKFATNVNNNEAV